MSQLDDTLKAIIDSRQYMDGDTSYMTQEELDEGKQQIKDLMIEIKKESYETDIEGQWSINPDLFDQKVNEL